MFKREAAPGRGRVYREEAGSTGKRRSLQGGGRVYREEAESFL